MDKIRLKWRVFGLLLGFCGLLLVILWLFQTVLLKETYKLVRKFEIMQAVTLVEKNINSEDLNTILKQVEVDKEIIVMQTSDFIPPPDQNDRKGDHGKFPRETITQTKVFTLLDGQTISLTFHAMITPVDATVSTLEIQLAAITIFMLLLSVGLAIIMAKWISRPIERINQSAKVLAKGDYDVLFAGRGFLEITELSSTLNTAAQELSKVEGLRRELMANISHDLRTPLALIYSYAEMMHDFPGEITEEQTQMIMDESKRLSSLVNDVLDIANLEAGTAKAQITRYNLTESIGKTVRRIAEMTKADGYQFVYERQDEVFVQADEGKITQVLYNLLTNAIHYGGSDKMVVVRQEREGDFIRVEVRDRGEGIPPEQLKDIWQRYYKIDKKHKRSIAGTGLGLSIVQKIIDLHGGKCGVTSVLGKGSCFWFSLRLDGAPKLATPEETLYSQCI